MSQHAVVSLEEWTTARKKLLLQEKELTRLRDSLAQKRQELPWTKVDSKYRFDGPRGQVSLSELFDGRGQLIIYHFMLGPDWKEGCPSCSFVADHFDGMLVHLKARDVSLAVVSRAPFAQIAAFKERMGWSFNWVSSNANSFNFDYRVSFTKEEVATGKVVYNYESMEFPFDEAPGMSVFTKTPDGCVYHTYSTYGRGVEALVGTYSVLDLVPKGRDEAGLPHSMAWVRHHDRYDNTVSRHSELAVAEGGESCCGKCESHS